jgi:hypothetical protein
MVRCPSDEETARVSWEELQGEATCMLLNPEEERKERI